MLKNLCYHTHNKFCDGKNTISEMVKSAVYQGVCAIGISSHAPLKVFNKWSILSTDIDDYLNEIEIAKSQFLNQIKIFSALEIDYIPNDTYSFDYFREKMSLDYTIGSVHLVKNIFNNQLWFIDGDKKICQQNFKTIFNNNIKLAISTYYSQIRKMVETQSPNIIAHLDKVVMNTAGALFNESEEWYHEEVMQTLKLIKKSGSILEINSRGIYKNKWATTFPSPKILREANILDIPIIISTDAHSIEEITRGYNQARIIAMEAGYSTQSYFEDGKWNQIEL